MKKLPLLFLFFPLLCTGQIFVFEDTDLEWNVTKMTIKGQFDQTQIDGSLSSVNIGYNKYCVVEGDFGSLAFEYRKKPSSYDESLIIENIYLSSSPLKNLIKAIMKDNFSKVDIIHSDEMIFVRNKEILLKRQLAQEQLDKNIEKHNGVFRVKIIRSSDINFTDEFGTLYITNVGFTLKTDIPSMNRISGSFSIPSTNEIEEGEFSGNLGSSTSLYDVFTLIINKTGTAVGLTLATDSYSVYDTTSMIIVEKLID